MEGVDKKEPCLGEGLTGSSLRIKNIHLASIHLCSCFLGLINKYSSTFGAFVTKVSLRTITSNFVEFLEIGTFKARVSVSVRSTPKLQS